MGSGSRGTGRPFKDRSESRTSETSGNEFSGAKRKREDSKSQPSAKAPTAPRSVVASRPPAKVELPSTTDSMGRRKNKITKSTQTPLSRMMASQKGRASSIDEQDSEEVDSDAPLDDEPVVPRSKKSRTSAFDSEAPLDPSIMDNAFGASRGRKAEQDEADEIAWLEWKLGKGNDDDGSDGLEGQSCIYRCFRAATF